MIKEAELYTQVLQTQLTAEEGKKKVTYGTASTRYEVRQVMDVRNLTQIRCYRITCTQRLVIPAQTIFKMEPNKKPNFDDYPVLLSSQFSLIAPHGDVRLQNYSPRTVNTTVAASASQSASESGTNSRQHTSGSSTSETNSYGTSASLGFFGDLPTGSLGFDYSHSSTAEQNRSNTTGSERSSSAEHGESDAMSVKDWASYAYLDVANTRPTWVWGQEYPWDVIQYRYGTGTNVTLPAFVEDRMFETVNKVDKLVLPPSQLSLFGIDFTMKAAWLVKLPQDIAEQTVKIEHALSYLRGSHGLDNGTRYVRLDAAPIDFNPESPALDLTLLGLDPIRNGSARNGAVIGFIPSKFVTLPPKAGSTFKILSEGNTLQVTGGGFDSPMLATVTDPKPAKSKPTTLTVQFKIVDTRNDYALFMKHWKTTDVGCTLTFVFNGNQKEPVVRHVDWKEGEGGEENLSSIVMRNRDYTSIDYHDYLVMGLNTVEITITPNKGSVSAGYCLRALAVGEQ
jgi:hypothetical protein